MSRKRPDKNDARTNDGVPGKSPAPPVTAFLQLIRVALAPSAISDIVVGVALGFGSQWPGSPLPWLLLPASLGIYHGAMALNDWSDRVADARTRPERPIPSGAISARLALSLAVILVLGGVFWAFGAGVRAGIWMSVVATLAVTYDVAGRGPLRGPLLLGMCRAGNLGAGLLAPWLIGAATHDSASFAGPGFPALGLAAAYGLHVFFIGRLGRLEDDEDERELAQRPTAALRGAAYTALAIPVMGAVALGADALRGDTGFAAAAGLAVSAALAAWNGSVLLSRLRASAGEGWTRASVGAATGLCLRRLPLLTASIAAIGVFLGPAAVAAVLVALVGARISAVLRRAFPLT